MMKKGKNLNKRLLELKTKNFVNYLKTSIDYTKLEIDAYERQFKEKEYEFFFNTKKSVIIDNKINQ